MKKDIEWLKNRLTNTLKFEAQNDREIGFKVAMEEVIELLDQLDEPETLSQGYNQQAYRDGFKEGERQTAEYFESITEEPSKEQVWKYLSEHGIEVVDKEPETVASVIADFYKSVERLKKVLGTEVEVLEE